MLVRDINLSALIEILNDAKEFDAKYFGVLIKMNGLKKPEVVIDRIEDFDKKLQYYSRTYNYNLIHNYSPIQIIDFTYGNTFAEIEMGLDIA